MLQVALQSQARGWYCVTFRPFFFFVFAFHNRLLRGSKGDGREVHDHGKRMFPSCSLMCVCCLVDNLATNLLAYAVDDIVVPGCCDSGNNSAECGYDSGDCCPCTCESTEFNTCGQWGFACIDPAAACVDDDDITAEMVENCFVSRAFRCGLPWLNFAYLTSAVYFPACYRCLFSRLQCPFEVEKRSAQCVGVKHDG